MHKVLPSALAIIAMAVCLNPTASASCSTINTLSKFRAEINYGDSCTINASAAWNSQLNQVTLTTDAANTTCRIPKTTILSASCSTAGSNFTISLNGTTTQNINLSGTSPTGSTSVTLLGNYHLPGINSTTKARATLSP